MMNVVPNSRPKSFWFVFPPQYFTPRQQVQWAIDHPYRVGLVFLVLTVPFGALCSVPLLVQGEIPLAVLAAANVVHSAVFYLVFAAFNRRAMEKKLRTLTEPG